MNNAMPFMCISVALHSILRNAHITYMTSSCVVPMCNLRNILRLCVRIVAIGLFNFVATSLSVRPWQNSKAICHSISVILFAA